MPTSVLTLAALASLATAAQGAPSTIAVSEIERGMKGYGLTVFQGYEPQRFDVEVIDVLHNFRPDQDLILIRTDHPILDHATTVAGMSGSPIYIDGRLAGAYAYGWPFGKDPVAGVTPIANMLAEMRRPVRPDSFPGARPLAMLKRARSSSPTLAPSAPPTTAISTSTRPSRARLAGLPPMGKDSLGQGALGPLSRHLARLGIDGHTPDDPHGLAPAATPLMLGGFTDGVAHLLEEKLAALGFVALQAGGGRARRTREERARFVDGGSIGVQLIRGDVSVTGVGTVTHVDRGRLIGFGHPMMNAGEVGLPTATAKVLHVLASQSKSFKIAEAEQPLGTLIHDRQAAIVVDPNLVPEVVPVTLRLHGVPGAPRTEWKMEVASHRLLTPMLVFAAIVNALQATASDQSEAVFTARSKVTLNGREPISVVDHGFMQGGPSDAGALSRTRLFDLLEVAYGNPYEETRITQVELDLSVRFERDVVEIIDAAIASEEVDPGEKINVHVTTKRFGEPEEIRIVPITIPERLAGENIKLRIQPGDDVRLDAPEPRSTDDLIELVKMGYPSTSLAVSLELPSRGLRFRGHVVRSLPPSALAALRLRNDSDGGRMFATQVHQVMDYGKVLTGSAQLKLKVRETPRR